MNYPDLYHVGPEWQCSTKPKVLAIDTETSGLAIHDADFQCLLVSWSFATNSDPKTPKSIVLAGGYCSLASEIPNQVRNWFQDPAILKVGHHVKFDAKVLATLGIKMVNFCCTRILFHLLDESSTDEVKEWSTISASLQALALRANLPYWEAPKDRCLELFPNILWIQMFCHFKDMLMSYAAWDAWGHLQLYHSLWAELPTEAMRRHAKFLMTVEAMLLEVETNGIRFDVAKATEAREDYQLQANQKLEEILELAPEIHNPKGKTGIGTKKLAEWLFHTQGCQVLARTEKTRKPKLDEDILKKLIVHARTPEKARKCLTWLLEYRKLLDVPKKVTTYLKAVRNGYLYPSFKLHGTRTGRLSSGSKNNPEDENVQNVPRQGPLRKCFVSRFKD